MTEDWLTMTKYPSSKLKVEPATRMIEVIDDFETGRRMKQARERMGLSQKEFAEIVGHDAPFVCALENGRKRWSTRRITEWNNVFAKLENETRTTS